MDKILIDVMCPATSKTYDFWVSKKLFIKDARFKIMQEIMDYEGSSLIFPDMEEVFAFAKDKEAILGDDLTFEQAGVKSGDILMLV